MGLQERDLKICRVIYDCGGILTTRQVHTLFWKEGTDIRGAQKRLEILAKAGYVTSSQDDPKAAGTHCIGWKGASWLAKGVEEPWDEIADENKQSRLQRALKKEGFYWRRMPNLQQLDHDLAVGDCYIAVTQSVRQQPNLQLASWIPENEFRAEVNEQKSVPDAYFVVHDQQRAQSAQFLLEVDQGEHTYEKVTEKLKEELVFWQSDRYQALSGSHQSAGRWLWVCNTEGRMKKILEERLLPATKKYATLFLFTTINHIKTQNMLTVPIWYRVGRDSPQMLLED